MMSTLKVLLGLLVWAPLIYAVVRMVLEAIKFFSDESGERKPLWLNRAIGIVIGLIIMILGEILLGGLGAVPTGHRGIVLRWNAPSGRVLGPGIYYVNPISEKVVNLSVQIKAYTMVCKSASHDLQDVTTTVTLNYAVIPGEASSLYRDVGINYDSVIVKPAVNQSVKSTTSQFNAENLVTERPLVKDSIKSSLVARLSNRFIIEELSITDFEFSPDFTAAIERKVTATQNALTEENNLKVEQFKAQQRVAIATGEAKAIEIQAKAIESQGGKSYIGLKWVEKWNGVLPMYILGGNTSMLMQMPEMK